MNGLFGRINTMLEDGEVNIKELPEDFADLDYEDAGTLSFTEIMDEFKTNLNMNMPTGDLLDFIKFLAMRHSKSLD